MIPPTLLERLIHQQTQTAVTQIVLRNVDILAQELTCEILQDPEYVERLRALVRAAFTQAIANLNTPAPVADDPPS